MTLSWVDAPFCRVVIKQVSEDVSYSSKTSRKEKVIYAKTQVEGFWAVEVVNNCNGPGGTGEHLQGPAVSMAAAVQRLRGKRDEQVGEVSRSPDEKGPHEVLAQSCLFSIHSVSVPSPRSQCLSFLHLFCFLSFCIWERFPLLLSLLPIPTCTASASSC